MEYDRTLTTVKAFAAAGRLEEWIHAYLLSEDGHNKPFSDGLRLVPRRYYGPAEMPLDLFTRCCGPEKGMKYPVPAESFERHVAKLTEVIRSGADMTPLIVQFSSRGFTLTDGNHRFEAYTRLGIASRPVIVWTTGDEDSAEFLRLYGHYFG